MTDDLRDRLLEAYPPELVDRILAFREKGTLLSSRRAQLTENVDRTHPKIWEKAFQQIEAESEAYAVEGRELKKEMEGWLTDGQEER